MNVRTYRAKSMQAALARVREELGPDASVLHTREVQSGLLRRFLVGREVEVTASDEIEVPSRFRPAAPPNAIRHEAAPRSETTTRVDPPQAKLPPPAGALLPADSMETPPTNAPEPPTATRHVEPSTTDHRDFRARLRAGLKNQQPLDELPSVVERLSAAPRAAERCELPETLFQLFTDLIEAEVSEELARELVDRLREEHAELGAQLPLLRGRLARMVEEELQVAGPIKITPGARRLVALVGPTGVGKTTTIAKLAANYRLRERRNVGLITVDTYRIAAVEQLRTYADIIDLPIQVVSTPREMREAVQRMASLDLVLIDTAGRSPRDEVRLQELRALLADAQPDEVQLVLSTVSSAAGLIKTAERFAQVGTTSLLLTKLDEATGLGNLLPLVRSCRLPLSYVTNGQNVPDDIRPADRAQLARIVLGMETSP